GEMKAYLRSKQSIMKPSFREKYKELAEAYDVLIENPTIDLENVIEDADPRISRLTVIDRYASTYVAIIEKGLKRAPDPKIKEQFDSVCAQLKSLGFSDPEDFITADKCIRGLQSLCDEVLYIKMPDADLSFEALVPDPSGFGKKEIRQVPPPPKADFMSPPR